MSPFRVIGTVLVGVLLGFAVFAPTGAQFHQQGGNQQGIHGGNNMGGNNFQNQQGPNNFQNQQGPNNFQNQQGPNNFQNQQGPNNFQNQQGSNQSPQQNRGHGSRKNKGEGLINRQEEIDLKMKLYGPPKAECLCPVPLNARTYNDTTEYFCAVQLNSPKCVEHALYECTAPLTVPKFSSQCERCSRRMRPAPAVARCKIGGVTVSYSTFQTYGPA